MIEERSSTLALPTGDLHVREYGAPDATPVLLIHGAAVHGLWWHSIVPFLSDEFRLIVPDLRGHGRSSWSDPPSYMIEDFALDASALVQRESEPVVVIGHSMGGRVAAWLAAGDEERIAGLGLLDTRLHGLRQESVDRWRGRGSTPRKVHKVHESRERAERSFRLWPPEPGIAEATHRLLASNAVVEVAPGQWSLRFDRAVLDLDGSRAAGLEDLLPRVHCPVLVVYGSDSEVTGRKGGDKLATAFRDCEVKAFPGGHHFPLAQPEAVGSELRKFIRRCSSV